MGSYLTSERPQTTCRCGTSSCSPLMHGHAHIVSDELAEMHQRRNPSTWKQSAGQYTSKRERSMAKRSKSETLLAALREIESMKSRIPKTPSKPKKRLEPLSPYLPSKPRQPSPRLM